MRNRFTQYPTSVELSVLLINVADLDAKSETMDVSFYAYLDWVDATLAWNPDDFDNYSMIVMPAESIPLPAVYVFNEDNKGITV